MLFCEQWMDMNKKVFTTPDWHEIMYGSLFTDHSIGSNSFRDLAKMEVEFILNHCKLSKNAKILDIPCGAGRHSYHFSKKNYLVTGVDINESCIVTAKKYDQQKNSNYLQGDMIRLSDYKNSYNLTCNLYSSFGYFNSDEDNEEVFKELTSTLKPGGYLVMSLSNRSWVLNNYQSDLHFEDGMIHINQYSNYNPETKYNESVFSLEESSGGKNFSSYHRLRLYEPIEIISMYKKFGFNNIKIYGSFEGEKFSKNKSIRPVYIGRLPINH